MNQNDSEIDSENRYRNDQRNRKSLSENEREIMIDINEKIIDMMDHNDNQRSFNFIDKNISMEGNIKIRISDNINLKEIRYFNNNSDYQIFDMIAKNKYSVIIKINIKDH